MDKPDGPVLSCRTFDPLLARTGLAPRKGAIQIHRRNPNRLRCAAGRGKTQMRKQKQPLPVEIKITINVGLCLLGIAAILKVFF